MCLEIQKMSGYFVTIAVSKIMGEEVIGNRNKMEYFANPFQA